METRKGQRLLAQIQLIWVLEQKQAKFCKGCRNQKKKERGSKAKRLNNPMHKSYKRKSNSSLFLSHIYLASLCQAERHSKDREHSLSHTDTLPRKILQYLLQLLTQAHNPLSTFIVFFFSMIGQENPSKEGFSKERRKQRKINKQMNKSTKNTFPMFSLPLLCFPIHVHFDNFAPTTKFLLKLRFKNEKNEIFYFFMVHIKNPHFISLCSVTVMPGLWSWSWCWFWWWNMVGALATIILRDEECFFIRMGLKKMSFLGSKSEGWITTGCRRNSISKVQFLQQPISSCFLFGV